MIDKLLKGDNIVACFVTAIIGLMAYMLLVQVDHTKEIAQLQTQASNRDSFTAQQLNRIESNQTALSTKIDNLNNLVLRNIKITNS